MVNRGKSMPAAYNTMHTVGPVAALRGRSNSATGSTLTSESPGSPCLLTWPKIRSLEWSTRQSRSCKETQPTRYCFCVSYRSLVWNCLRTVALLRHGRFVVIGPDQPTTSNTHSTLRGSLYVARYFDAILTCVYAFSYAQALLNPAPRDVRIQFAVKHRTWSLRRRGIDYSQMWWVGLVLNHVRCRNRCSKREGRRANGQVRTCEEHWEKQITRVNGERQSGNYWRLLVSGWART